MRDYIAYHMTMARTNYAVRCSCAEAMLDVKVTVSFGWALKHKKIQPAAAHPGTSM